MLGQGQGPGRTSGKNKEHGKREVRHKRAEPSRSSPAPGYPGLPCLPSLTAAPPFGLRNAKCCSLARGRHSVLRLVLLHWPLGNPSQSTGSQLGSPAPCLASAPPLGGPGPALPTTGTRCLTSGTSISTSGCLPPLQTCDTGCPALPCSSSSCPHPGSASPFTGIAGQCVPRAHVEHFNCSKQCVSHKEARRPGWC